MAEIGKIRGFAYIVWQGVRLKPKAKAIDKAREAHDVEAEKRIIHEITSYWGKKVMDHFDVHVEIVNPENIPEDGPVVYIGNHQSYFDMFSLFSIIPHQFNFIAKMEWAKIPLFGHFIEQTRGILLDRGNLRQAVQVFNEGTEYLKEGFSMAVFPEGTRSKGKGLGELKAGTFKLATKAEVPIVPVSIDGSYKIFEEKGKFVTGQTITFTFHDQIPTKGMTHDEICALPSRMKEIFKEDLEA